MADESARHHEPYKPGDGIGPVPEDGSNCPVPVLTRCGGCGRSLYWVLATGPPRCESCRNGAGLQPV